MRDASTPARKPETPHATDIEKRTRFFIGRLQPVITPVLGHGTDKKVGDPDGNKHVRF